MLRCPRGYHADDSDFAAPRLRRLVEAYQAKKRERPAGALFRWARVSGCCAPYVAENRAQACQLAEAGICRVAFHQFFKEAPQGSLCLVHEDKPQEVCHGRVWRARSSPA